MTYKQKHQIKQTDKSQIPEEWETIELQQISDVVDSLHQTPKYSQVGIPMVRATDIKFGNLNLTKTFKVSKEVYDEFTRNHKPQRGDTVMSRVGTYFVTSFVDTDEVFCMGQNTVVFHPSINPKFVYYALNSNFVKNQIQENLVGSGGQKTISLADIGSLLLLKPKDSELMDNLVGILSAIDSKISINQQVNKILEDVGNMIFKQWFVDFEFPNQDGKSYKYFDGEMIFNENIGKEIPKGWKVEKLGECVDVVKGCSYRSIDLKESNTALITLKSINRGGGFNQVGYKEYVGDYNNDAVLKDGEILIAQTDLTQKAEIIGRPAIVNSLGKYQTVVASLDLQIIRPKNNFSKNYVYQSLQTEKFHNHALSYTNGTTVLHLNKNAIPEFDLIVPSKEILIKFDKIIEPIMMKIASNEAEIQTLIELLNSLLPKLMSGKIKVIEGRK